MKQKRLLIVVGAFFFLFFTIASCTQKKQNIPAGKHVGTIDISVDESFQPVIEEQIKMFEATYPGSKINAHYKPEAECLKDIIRDSSTSLVIVTRGLNREEERYFDDSLNYIPIWDKLASDAVAVIVNEKSEDTIFTKERLKRQLSGEMGNKQQIIFDGLNATSNIRFAIDSILKGKKFDTSVVKAMKSSKEVMDYVAANENAIGIVGISWIGNPEDRAQLEMLKKVKMAYVRCEICADTPYVKPTQFGIMSRRYPLVRGLFYILKENYAGVGSSFVSFLKYEVGQLIFRRAYLSPAKMNFSIRNVKINEKLKKD